MLPMRLAKGSAGRLARAALCSALAAVVAWGGAEPAACQQSPAGQRAPVAGREMAVTFDDLPLGGAQFGGERLRAMTAKLLAAFAEHRVPVVGFVNEGKLYRAGEVDAQIAVLRSWVDAGLELGNHTYSHPSFLTTPLQEFQDDFVRGDTVTRLLLAAKGRKPRYFRHPFLRTGPTAEAKEAFERFLAARGYEVAPVTVDNSDWMFAFVYAAAAARDDRETMRRVGRAYVAYMDEVFDFYERVSQALFGRQIRQILLLHANELNADYFGEVAASLRRRGYAFVTLEEALKDEAYREADRYAGPAGVSWFYRWDFTRGRRQVNWREEPEVPAFVRKLYDGLRGSD
ncbi:MAG TPA: polysaccharide deacetylase family protein [Pyrinomonadaceae bacterium]|nr:polysaccharide deacetylase family protein [Pyrinomonadaceae bacterium]